MVQHSHLGTCTQLLLDVDADVDVTSPLASAILPLKIGGKYCFCYFFEVHKQQIFLR